MWGVLPREMVEDLDVVLASDVVSEGLAVTVTVSEGLAVTVAVTVSEGLTVTVAVTVSVSK